MDKKQEQQKQSSHKIICAIDDGFAHTKGARLKNGNINLISEKTHITHGTHLVATFNGEEEGNVYRTEDKVYTVGYTLKQDETKYDDYLFSPMNRVIIHHTLRKLGVKPGDHVALSVSVPIRMFFSHSKEEIHKQKQASLSVPVYAVDENESIIIDEVRIFPEAASAYIDFMLTSDGQDATSGLLPNVAIVDIGGRTTDIAVMLGGNKIDIARSKTIDVGVMNLFESAKDVIRHAAIEQIGTSASGISIQNAMAERAILNFVQNRDAAIHLYGKPMKLEKMKVAIDGFIEHIYGIVQNQIQDIAHQMDNILIIGGGSALVGKRFAQNYPANLQVPNMPQFANVRGMLKYMHYLKK